MLAPCIPGQIADGAMVLVPVIAIVSEDQVRIYIFFDLFEEFLNFCSLIREKTVVKLLHDHFFGRFACLRKSAALARASRSR